MGPVKMGLAAAGIVTAVVVGGLVIQAVTLPMRSATGLAERTLNPANIERTYERFHDLAKGFDARLAQIATHKGLLLGETDAAEKRRLNIELAGMRQACRETATNYNADAAKTNRVIFQGRDAPTTLNMEMCDR